MVTLTSCFRKALGSEGESQGESERERERGKPGRERERESERAREREQMRPSIEAKETYYVVSEGESEREI